MRLSHIFDMYFKPDEVEKLKEEYSNVLLEYNQLLLEYTNLQLKNLDTDEYIKQGFLRRLGTLKRCIQNVYRICPPDKLNKPINDELYDLGINLQSFVFNVYGCIDNLAWIWVKETNYKYTHNTEVTFKNEDLRKKITVNFKTYIDGLSKWFKNLENFRHALAHRIPLYVPPFQLTIEEGKRYTELEYQKFEAIKQRQYEKLSRLKAEQDELGTFIPCMTHSYKEKAPLIGFHGQVFNDWKTIVEFSKMLLKELRLIS